MEPQRKSQNEKHIVLWGIVILIFAIGIFLYSYPFYQPVDHTITATVYINGRAADTTTVTMQGEKSNYVLPREEHYNGTFAVAYFPSTCMEGVRSEISWDRKWGTHITYINIGNFGLLGTTPWVDYISEDMTEFVLRDRDTNTLIATSEELLHLYAQLYLPHTP